MGKKLVYRNIKHSVYAETTWQSLDFFVLKLLLVRTKKIGKTRLGQGYYASLSMT